MMMTMMIVIGIGIWIGTVDATIESDTSVSLVDIEEHEESMSGIHPDECRWKYIMAMRGANVVLTDLSLSLSLSVSRSLGLSRESHAVEHELGLCGSKSISVSVSLRSLCG